MIIKRMYNVCLKHADKLNAERGCTDMAERNTYRYLLQNGSEIVYVGITNDPVRREAEHSVDKNFTSMKIVGPKVTRTTAEQWEENRIATYKSNHEGRRPKYNGNDTGK